MSFRDTGASARRIAAGLVLAAGTLAADMLYPRTCTACGRAMTSASVGLHLCWDCRSLVIRNWGGSSCDRCGLVFAAKAQKPFPCGFCQARPPAFSRARSAAAYREPVRSMLHDFKYRRATWLRFDLADILEACVRAHFSESDYEAVCPIPLHRSRQRKRGYNQADLLAVELAGRLGMPCFSNALRRVRPTASQTILDAVRRRENISGAFAINPNLIPWLKGARILLVDDIMTTGATVDEAARVLKRAGVGSVEVVTVARD